MSKPTVETLQRTLALIEKIDRLRDGHTDPLAMLSSIAHLLAEEMQADLCLLLLRDRETAAADLKVVQQRQEPGFPIDALTTPEVALKMARETAVTPWTGAEVGVETAVSIALMPIILGDSDRLGTMILSRRATPFTPADIDLLTVAESHIDSAVMQAHRQHDLQRGLLEIQTIYHFDRIRDQGLPFDDMLNLVVSKLEENLSAEAGFVMLYDYSGATLEMRAVSHSRLFETAAAFDQLHAIANESLESGQLICRSSLGSPVQSVMCLPLILNERLIGVLGVANRRGQGNFQTADQRLLAAIGSQMDTAIFESLEQKRLRRVLGRSVDPRIMQRLLANPGVDFLEGERRTLTVLYADIRGSTSLAEQTPAEQLVRFINAYLSDMTNVILAFAGTLDKFVGDEVMALFGAPFAQEDHALRAVRTGLAMQQAHQALLADWTAQGGLMAPIGIGIATGEAIVGEMGSPQRTDYTAIGPVANLGARICSAAQGGQVLVSPNTYALIRNQVEAAPIHGMSFKGVSQLMTVYEVTAVRGE